MKCFRHNKSHSVVNTGVLKQLPFSEDETGWGQCMEDVERGQGPEDRSPFFSGDENLGLVSLLKGIFVTISPHQPHSKFQLGASGPVR